MASFRRDLGLLRPLRSLRGPALTKQHAVGSVGIPPCAVRFGGIVTKREMGILKRLTNLIGGGGDTETEKSYSPIRITEIGDKIIFKGEMTNMIRLMLFGGSINGMYWLYHLYNCYMYDGMVIHGIDLGGKPIYGYAGLVVTGFLAVVTRTYAHNAIRYSYVSADGQRLGFQMHTMLGFPGHKIEAKPANVEFEENAKVRGGVVRLKIKGLDKFVLLDYDGDYFDDGVFKKILAKQKIPDYLAGSPELVYDHMNQKGKPVVAPSGELRLPAEGSAEGSVVIPPPPPHRRSESKYDRGQKKRN
jgi:hypothetical protein